MGQRYYIHTEALCVGYEETPIISDMDLKITKGEIISLIGPNGAGKTTVLRSIIHQLAPLAGVIYLEQKSLDEILRTELAKKMSVVLTERIRTELMSVQEMVETGRYPYTGRFGQLTEQDHRIVEEAMELTRTTELREKDFMKISDGQKQRVLLARALAQQPEVIVLDEPTSFLDIKYKLEFLSILKHFSREKNVTVILSLHEVELAELISDKVACFRNGKLERFGTPQEVFADGYLLRLYDIELEDLEPEFGNLAKRLAGEKGDIE